MKAIILLFLITLNTACSYSQTTSDEIIFYSSGSSFAPRIKVDTGAQILWTWNDSTTSTSASPSKEYGSSKIRVNKLKVTPWSALKRINIGYDALDGGSDSIELVDDQKVLKVLNLNLVAPHLTVWCSSYNMIDSLDFSDFTNLKVIECYYSSSLVSVILKNNPKLIRACFEACHLYELNLSECPALEDIRGAINKYKNITFSNSIDKVWHICVRDNPQLLDQNLFEDVNKFVNLSDLFIWNTNQTGNFKFNVNNNKNIYLLAYDNYYTSLDLSNALQNRTMDGRVDFRNNLLTKVNIKNCAQIRNINLSGNLLSSLEINNILKDLDDFKTGKGIADLRYNSTPTDSGLVYLANLQARSWTVLADKTADSLAENNHIVPVFIYPNPTTENIVIKTKDGAVLIRQIDLYNPIGWKLNTINNITNHRTVDMNLSQYPEGVYYVSVLTNERKYLFKVILL